MKNIILAWIIFLLMAITLITAILTANNRYEHNLCSPDTVYVEVYKQKSDWELLKIAIIWQESKGNSEAVNNNAVGIYQITPIYVKECNRILGYDKYKHIDAFVDFTANDMFEVVQSCHNPKKCIKKAIKLHNRGDKYYQEVMDKFRMLKFNQYKD